MDGPLAIPESKSTLLRQQYHVPSPQGNRRADQKRYKKDSTQLQIIPIITISVWPIPVFDGLCTSGCADWVRTGYEHSVFSAVVSRTGHQ